MSVEEVDFRSEDARTVRHILGRSVKMALDDHGDDLRGFALVTWDNRGRAHTTYLTEFGAVNARLMPAFVHDALNHHIAVNLSEESATYNVTI